MADELAEALSSGDLQSFSDAVNFAAHIGIELVAAEKNRVEGRLPVKKELTNHLPNVHGGAIMSFADAMGAIGAHLNTPEGAAGRRPLKARRISLNQQWRETRCTRSAGHCPSGGACQFGRLKSPVTMESA